MDSSGTNFFLEEKKTLKHQNNETCSGVENCRFSDRFGSKSRTETTLFLVKVTIAKKLEDIPSPYPFFLVLVNFGYLKREMGTCSSKEKPAPKKRTPIAVPKTTVVSPSTSIISHQHQQTIVRSCDCLSPMIRSFMDTSSK